MDLSPGQELLHYRLAEKLGEGGMGAVWRAVDTSLDREVAIKVLPAAFAADPARLARFQREAKVLASLSHPHVAGIYSVHESGGVHFLAMELVAGENLAQHLARSAVPADEALDIARQVAEGLEAAHESGIVHRDLKPANIQIMPDGKVKVLDFGLAKALAGDQAPDESGDLTQSPTITAFGTVAGVILGTAAYMSPEQARGKAVDRRADIWAFGCVLYELLTGRVAWQGDTVTDTLAAIVRAEPDWTTLPAATPPAVVRLLRRCLDKNPATRLRDIGEARVLLSDAGALAEAGAGDAGAGATGTSGASATSGRTGAGLWAAAALVLAMVSVALGVTLWRRPAPEPQRPVTFQVAPPADNILRSMGPVAAPAMVSPDGRLVVMGLMEPGGEHRLWVHSLADGASRPLSGTEGGSRPFWSPDSRSVGFFAGGKLQRVDVAGGPVVSIADARSGRGGTWNRDGIIVFTPDYEGPIYQVPATGGEATLVPGQPGSDFAGSHRYPAFLPDGRHFLYMALTHSGTSGVEAESDIEIHLASLDGGAPRTLLQGVSNAVYAAGHILALKGDVLEAHPFDPDSLELTGEAWEVARDVVYDRGFERAIFSAGDTVLAYQSGSSANRSDLRWFDRQGQMLGRFDLNLVQGNPDISPDGRYVVFFSAETGPVNIWIQDLQRDLRTRFTFEDTQQVLPVWSPTGDRIAYSSDLDGHWSIVIKDLAGGEPEVILTGEPTYYVTDWSADGRWLIITANDPGERQDIMALDLQGDGKPQPVVTTPFTESLGVLSPNGHWLAYGSEASGRPEIYLTPFPGGGRKVQVSRNGGSDARWGAGGETLYFRDLFNVLREVAIAPGEPLPELREERSLFQTYAVADLGNRAYDVSPDGQRFLVNGSEARVARQPLTVRLNWLAARPRGR